MTSTLTPPAGPTPGPTEPEAPRKVSVADTLSRVLYRHPKLRLTSLLSLPMLWLGVLYIGSLLLLLLTAFWSTDTFTSEVVPDFTLENFTELATQPAYLATAARTIGIAACVTILCAVVAVPLGLYMAKIASPGVRTWLSIAITLPLWAGYLVKVFSWRITFSENGPLNWLLHPLGLSGPGYGLPALTLTLTYLWFPYMAVPVYTAFRSIPDNLFEASADLGAKAWRTVFSVALPLLKPAIIAGSVFTFSLSLGDYIAAQFVGGKTQVIGTVIAANINLNPPLAAAFAMVPIIVVVIYLFVARRTGALKHF